MAIAKMKRLRVISLARQRDELLAKLLSAGCVEITEPAAELADPAWTALLHRDGASLAQLRSQQSAVNSALEALQQYAGLKKGLFLRRRGVEERVFLRESTVTKALKKAGEINDCVGKLRQSQTQSSHLQAQRLSLGPWASLDLPLETGETEYAQVNFGVCPAGAELSALEAALEEAAPTATLTEISTDKELHYLLLLCHKAEGEAAVSALRRQGFSLHSFQEFSGTAAENIARIDARLAALEKEQQTLLESLAKMNSAGWSLRLCADRLNGELAKANATQRLLTDGTVVLLQGWVPSKERMRVLAILEEQGCAWELTNPPEGEVPPVLLNNNRLIASMNMVTEMYSLPAYGGIDPNPLIFPFFTLFYGFMFADMGYGLVMFLAGWLLSRRFRPKGAMGNILQLLMVCGVTSFVCGALTGGFFGDLIPVVAEVFLHKEVVLPSLISPLDDPMTVLILGIGLGCVQLIVGQCVHIFMGFRDGEGVDALLDVVPWWIVFGGIALMALRGSAILLLLGVLALILTQGRHAQGFLKKLWGGISSLYDVTSWLSDVLSYSRLMALMLATTVIASVVNMLGTLPANLLVFIPIFLFGHSFNLGINLIGTYVHAARLQYLEFFGKFYKDGGRAFQPLRYQTKYVDVLNDAGEEVS